MPYQTTLDRGLDPHAMRWAVALTIRVTSRIMRSVTTTFVFLFLAAIAALAGAADNLTKPEIVLQTGHAENAQALALSDYLRTGLGEIAGMS